MGWSGTREVMEMLRYGVISTKVVAKTHKFLMSDDKDNPEDVFYVAKKDELDKVYRINITEMSDEFSLRKNHEKH